jgi:2-polyprenyl-3-methyl-5-hydroxy-6-metoxy-1,4-benzoquinol methylase
MTMDQSVTTRQNHCLFCGAPLEVVCVDLGVSPLANSFVPPDRRTEMEPFFPLRVFVCESCLLVQSEPYAAPETIFVDYAYFSSYSKTWLDHAEHYAQLMTESHGIDPESQVIEIASNDGAVLQPFAARGIPVLGVEPAANVAKVANQKGVPTIVEFFGEKLGAELGKSTPADLLIGNNVFAHVPDINGFTRGLKLALAPGGLITLEFPHLLNLLELNQFDTVYHEHFFYFSLGVAQRVFKAHGLRIFDVERIPTHGGSLRIFGCHADDERPDGEGLAVVAEMEQKAGLDQVATYSDFGVKTMEEKRRVLRLLVELKDKGHTIAGYGAAAKGTVLLNYCGVGTDFIDFIADLNPEKQGNFLPGVRIPIRAPEEIERTKPDYVFILPWNLREEVTEQLSFVRDWGGRFIARAPEIQTFD